MKAVIAISYARIHRKNLINFGVIPLLFENEADYNAISQGDILEISNIREKLETGEEIEVVLEKTGHRFKVKYDFSAREIDSLLAGGLINVVLHETKGIFKCSS